MISIIIPMFNSEQYIEKALKSVLNQTYRDYECIVVNDGSTDKSSQICKECVGDDKRFCIIDKENGGVVSAVKKGVLNATGEYLVFLDSDDFLEENALENIQSVIAMYEPDMVMYDFYKDYGNKKTLVNTPIKPEILFKENIDNIKDAYYKQGEICPARWNKAIRSEIVKNNLIYCNENIGMGDDINLVSLVFWEIKSFYYINKPLINYFQNETSFVHSYNVKHFYSYKELYKTLKTFFADKKSMEGFAEKVFFNNMKTLIQTLCLSSETHKIRKLRELLSDTFLKEIVLQFNPTNKKDKLIKIFMQKKMAICLYALSQINNIGKKDYSGGKLKNKS